MCHASFCVIIPILNIGNEQSAVKFEPYVIETYY